MEPPGTVHQALERAGAERPVLEDGEYEAIVLECRARLVAPYQNPAGDRVPKLVFDLAIPGEDAMDGETKLALWASPVLVPQGRRGGSHLCRLLSATNLLRKFEDAFPGEMDWRGDPSRVGEIVAFFQRQLAGDLVRVAVRKATSRDGHPVSVVDHLVKVVKKAEVWERPAPAAAQAAAPERGSWDRQFYESHSPLRDSAPSAQSCERTRAPRAHDRGESP